MSTKRCEELETAHKLLERLVDVFSLVRRNSTALDFFEEVLRSDGSTFPSWDMSDLEQQFIRSLAHVHVELEAEENRTVCPEVAA